MKEGTGKGTRIWTREGPVWIQGRGQSGNGDMLAGDHGAYGKGGGRDKERIDGKVSRGARAGDRVDAGEWTGERMEERAGRRPRDWSEEGPGEKTGELRTGEWPSRRRWRGRRIAQGMGQRSGWERGKKTFWSGDKGEDGVTDTEGYRERFRDGDRGKSKVRNRVGHKGGDRDGESGGDMEFNSDEKREGDREVNSDGERGGDRE